MSHLYLFNNDFRLQDNALLKKAIENCEELSFLAFLPSENWGLWRRKFYFESLHELNQNLKKKGHCLKVISKDDFYQYDFSQFKEIYTPQINLYDENQDLLFLEAQTNIVSLQTDRLLETIDFELPDIFTEFRKIVEKDFVPRENQVLEKSIWPRSFETDFKDLNPTSFPAVNVKTAFPFTGGETSASKRLKDYLWQTQSVLSYKKTRNGLLGLDYSTKFSPWLALGCLSPHQIYREIEKFEKDIHKNQSTYWVKFELWWREYFRWIGDKFGVKLFLKTGIKEKSLECIYQEEVFKNWVEGKTGQDFCDANMIELKNSGWMSNRGRQNVASFLVKDLKLPWKWGAKYFENQLIDYDPWSNYGNWQYVAGIGNDPRSNRYFNLVKQANTYDPDASFRSTWLQTSPND